MTAYATHACSSHLGALFAVQLLYATGVLLSIITAMYIIISLGTCTQDDSSSVLAAYNVQTANKCVVAACLPLKVSVWSVYLVLADVVSSGSG
jgi:hypothetical protein